MWITYARFKRPQHLEAVRARLLNRAGNGINVVIDDNGEIEIAAKAIVASLLVATERSWLAIEAFLNDVDVGLEPIGVVTHRSGAGEGLPTLVGAAEAAEVLGMTKPRVSQLANQDGFPRPVAKLKMGPVYTKRSIMEYKRNRPSARLPKYGFQPSSGEEPGVGQDLPEHPS